MVAAEEGILTKGEAVAEEVVGEGVGGGEYGEERVDSDKEKGGVEPGIATAEAGGADRESRKERKARKRRREEKAKEKERKRARREKGEKGDGSE